MVYLRKLALIRMNAWRGSDTKKPAVLAAGFCFIERRDVR
tara:strand:+ start:6644 stop:6763 length:120 start_codon:yes stop_codon:yes gene_type:complete